MRPGHCWRAWLQLSHVVLAKHRSCVALILTDCIAFHAHAYAISRTAHAKSVRPRALCTLKSASFILSHLMNNLFRYSEHSRPKLKKTPTNSTLGSSLDI
ncbi:hypothetical protein BKA63DRAFT_272477 [Paraphoma chrysanthemicola]|nr:hypothetical protein BKA63DRAFT_272477 [Paraphoma chrysanthemicola]